jgi:hypothetical protein
MKVNEYLPNLTSISIGPEKWPIFGRFLTLFPLKRPARREKNTSNMAATISDVMDDITCKFSIDNLSIDVASGNHLKITTLNLVTSRYHF